MDTLRFYFVTWNVATRPPEKDLNALLDFPSQFNKSKPLPDFYVIGLQEVKSQPQNMLLDALFSDPWTSVFNKTLCRSGYVSAKSIRLQGTLLLVYTQLKHLIHLRDIEAQYTKTGLGGMWGNKGAVSVRFNIYGCSVCLVNSHLTAHEHLLAERVDDYNTIIKQHTYHVMETSNILYHDYVFWVGDLNFRLDHPTGSSPTSEELVEMLKMVEKDKYNNILKHDQLKAVMETGEAFSEFSEAEINFPPTYKFHIGTDEYDVKRKPSWTDRILYKVIANNYENITLRADLVSYNHVAHYTVSDHKPVVAQFNIKIRQAFTRSVVELRKVARSNIRMRRALVPPPDIPGASYTADDGPGLIAAYSGMIVDSGPGLIAAYSGMIVDSGPGLIAAYSGMIDEEEEEEGEEEEEEAFSNYTEKTVEFATHNQIWYIGDAEFTTQCTLSPDVVVNPNDWIGIYDANFQSLDDYISYEYLAKVSVPCDLEHGESRTITLSFPVGSGVRTPGFYRFIYFSQPNSDVRSVLGISEPFEVSNKDDEEALVAEDPCEQPSSSPSPRSSTTTSDIFSDFTGLDVANLSRHFSNDLNID